MSWQILSSIAIGGAVGAVLRYLVLLVFGAPSGFPLGTLVVNVCGSFAIGVIYVLILEKAAVSELWRHLLMIGMLGGFTTFSSFSLEAVYLFESGRITMAFSYIVLSVFLCILAAFIAMQLTRSL
jgi:fluoride exporter